MADSTGGDPRAHCVVSDVTGDEDCARAAADNFGELHMPVYAASISMLVAHACLHYGSADDSQRICTVNIIGPLQMTRTAADALKASSTEAVRSAIVNISSRAALIGSNSSVPYAGIVELDFGLHLSAV